MTLKLLGLLLHELPLGCILLRVNSEGSSPFRGGAINGWNAWGIQLLRSDVLANDIDMGVGGFTEILASHLL